MRNRAHIYRSLKILDSVAEDDEDVAANEKPEVVEA